MAFDWLGHLGTEDAGRFWGLAWTCRCTRYRGTSVQFKSSYECAGLRHWRGLHLSKGLKGRSRLVILLPTLELYFQRCWTAEMISLLIGNESITILINKKAKRFDGSSFWNVNICYFSLSYIIIYWKSLGLDCWLGKKAVQRCHLCDIFHHFLMFHRPKD